MIIVNVPSRTTPGKVYKLRRTEGGRFEHLDPFECRGSLFRGTCQHEERAARMFATEEKHEQEEGPSV